MAAELVNSATSHKLREVDWSKNIQVCEYVANDPRLARDVVKVIKKRLGSRHHSSQLFAVMLLEMLMNNIGEQIYKQVIDKGLLPLLVKMVKKKSDLPVREKIFLLLDATQTALGGPSGMFPEYYNAYYDLVRSGVKFTARSNEVTLNHQEVTNLSNGDLAASNQEEFSQHTKAQDIPESSIIEKATNALGVLKEVLDAIDSQNPEEAADEFTLDLVEQCSFQKQRVMHLAMSSRDELLVCEAIDLNDQLQKVLQRHDALLSIGQKPENRLSSPNQLPSTPNHNTVADNRKALLPDRRIQAINHMYNAETEEEEEEEEPEQLFRRLRKGKACAAPEDERNPVANHFFPNVDSPTLGERQNRPLIRSLSSGEDSQPSPVAHPPVRLPPPPSKHVEREKFFRKKGTDESAVAGHMLGLSIHSHSPSSSRSGSLDFGY